jgi:hypothetical protein
MDGCHFQLSIIDFYIGLEFELLSTEEGIYILCYEISFFYEYYEDIILYVSEI